MSAVTADVERRLLTPRELWAARRDHMILPAARVVSPDGKQGSGFVLADENHTYVLTAHHVIQDAIQQTDRWDPIEKSSKKVESCLPVSVQVFRYDDKGRHTQTITTSAHIVAYNHWGDKWDFEGYLALLRLRTPVDGVPSARIISEAAYLDDVRLLDEIVMVGCPDGSKMPLPTTGHVASLTEERAGVGLLLSQVFGNPGSSGSAVYRYSGERGCYEVVALHSMTDGRGSLTESGRGNFLRLAVPAPEIRKFLEKNEFSRLVDEPEAEPASEDVVEEAASEDVVAESPEGNQEETSEQLPDEETVTAVDGGPASSPADDDDAAAQAATAAE